MDPEIRILLGVIDRFEADLKSRNPIIRGWAVEFFTNSLLYALACEEWPHECPPAEELVGSLTDYQMVLPCPM